MSPIFDAVAYAIIFDHISAVAYGSITLVLLPNSVSRIVSGLPQACCQSRDAKEFPDSPHLAIRSCGPGASHTQIADPSNNRWIRWSPKLRLVATVYAAQVSPSRTRGARRPFDRLKCFQFPPTGSLCIHPRDHDAVSRNCYAIVRRRSNTLYSADYFPPLGKTIESSSPPSRGRAPIV
jgi:hypothetical protein